jgi:hypothetical protein
MQADFASKVPFYPLVEFHTDDDGLTVGRALFEQVRALAPSPLTGALAPLPLTGALAPLPQIGALALSALPFPVGPLALRFRLMPVCYCRRLWALLGIKYQMCRSQSCKTTKAPSLTRK